MADFFHAGWGWFVAIATIAGLLGLFWLNRWMSTPPKQSDQVSTTGHVWDEDLKEYNHPLPRWWLNLFYITLVFALVYLVLYPGLGAFGGLLNWSTKDRYEREMAAAEAQYGPLFERYRQQDLAALAADPDAVKTGERLFVNYCSVCHGSDARGAPGYPNLRDNDWLWGGTPDAIKTSIAQGRTGTMPPWGAALGEQGVLEVTEYVRSLSGARTLDRTLVASGKEKFMQFCAACHGTDAKGNQALGAPNLTDEIWLHGSSKKAIMATIEKGRNSRMPAHAEFLGEAKVHLLAAYVYSLSQPANPSSIAERN